MKTSILIFCLVCSQFTFAKEAKREIASPEAKTSRITSSVIRDLSNELTAGRIMNMSVTEAENKFLLSLLNGNCTGSYSESQGKLSVKELHCVFQDSENRK